MIKNNSEKCTKFSMISANIIFVIGVLTQNINLSGFEFENQPLIFCLLIVFVFLNINRGYERKINREFFLYFAFCLFSLIVTYFKATSQDYVRAIIGPMVGWLIARQWPNLKITSFKLLIFFHCILLAGALLYKEAVVDILSSLGLRGVTYYEGWNAYFYSEPSYAALNIMCIYVGFLIKASETSNVVSKTKNWGVLTIALLIGAKSITAVVFAFLVFYNLFDRKIKNVIIIMVSSAVFIVSASPEILPMRFEILVSALNQSINESDILIFSELDPSSFYRLIANTVAVVGSGFKPFGYGTFLLNDSISMIEASDWYLVSTALTSSIVFSDVNVDTANTAQSIPFAFITYGGIIFVIYFFRVLHRLINMKIDNDVKKITFIYVLVLFVWQSQLGFVMFWFLVFFILSASALNEFNTSNRHAA